jgi:hypothetical protein
VVKSVKFPYSAAYAKLEVFEAALKQRAKDIMHAVDEYVKQRQAKQGKPIEASPGADEEVPAALDFLK